MRDQKNQFQDRLQRLETNSTRAYARAQRSQRTGMYDFVEEERRKRRGFPIRGFLTVVFISVALLWILKAYLIADMGEIAHQSRLADLQSKEDRLSQIGAVLVEKDPITVKLIEILFPAAAQRAQEAAGSSLPTIEENGEENQAE